MFRLPKNSPLAQGQLGPTWSITMIYYSSKGELGFVTSSEKDNGARVWRNVFKKTQGEKWNSSEEPLQRQRRRSLRGWEAALVHQSRNLLSNMAPLLMFEGRRMTNEENHTHADTCVQPVLSGALLRRAHAFRLALQTNPLAHACFHAQISSISLTEIESRTFLCDPLAAWRCSHDECCAHENVPTLSNRLKKQTFGP